MNDAIATLGRWELLASFGVAAALAGAAVWAGGSARARHLRFRESGGVCAIAAALLVLARADNLGDSGPSLLTAILFLVFGARRGAREPGWLRASVWCLPGAAVLAYASEAANATTVAAALGASVLLVTWRPIADTDQAWAETGVGPVLVGLAAAASFVCVPDTEQALPVFGAAAGVAVVALVTRSLRLGTGGTNGLVGMIVWSASVGGTGRASSLVGAYAAVVAVALESIVRKHDMTTPRLAGCAATVFVLGAEAVAVLVLSRVAGLEDRILQALLIAVPVLAALVVALWLGGAGPHAQERAP
jgi:hypothetical protein